MNYVFAADLHIRSNRPVMRMDDYFQTVIGKLRQIVQICNKYEADLVIAGDFFDNIKVGHKVVNMVLATLYRLKGKVLCIAGQHDMAYHTQDLSSSPLKTLMYLDKAHLLNGANTHFDGKYTFHGCSYGQEPPVPAKSNSILIIHKSITKGDPPFFLKDAISAKEAIKLYGKYKYVVSGDYHEPFMLVGRKTTVINCGPMLRQSVDQMDIKPTVWLLRDDSVKPIRLKVLPSSEVFTLENKVDIGSELSEDLEELIKTLKDKSNKPDYKSNVELLMFETKISKTTRDKVNSILREALNNG